MIRWVIALFLLLGVTGLVGRWVGLPLLRLPLT